MKRNMGKLDRLIRMTIAGLLILLVLSNHLLGTWAIIASVVAVFLFFTSLFGNSPIYSLLNFSTTKK
jgi:hypothetical protein